MLALSTGSDLDLCRVGVLPVLGLVDVESTQVGDVSVESITLIVPSLRAISVII